MRRLLLLIGTIASWLLAVQLTACTGRRDATVEVAAIGTPEAAFKTSGQLTTGAHLLLGATAEVLVALD